MHSKEIKQFIGQLSGEELKAYVCAFIDEDQEAGGKLLDFITRQLVAVGISNAEASVVRSFDAIRNAGGQWHSHWVTDWDSIYGDSFTLFERAHNAIAAAWSPPRIGSHISTASSAKQKSMTADI